MLLISTLGRVLKNFGKQSVRPFVEKEGLSSHPLGIWSSAVFTGNKETAEGFLLHGHIRVSIAIPVCGHGREAHTGRNPFEAQSPRV